MTFPTWSILPTTADIGFIAEAPSLSELFSVSAAALQSIRLGLRPSEEFPAKKGANFTISIKRSDRVDRDLVSWLEEINWTAEDKASVVHVERLDFSGKSVDANVYHWIIYTYSAIFCILLYSNSFSGKPNLEYRLI